MVEETIESSFDTISSYSQHGGKGGKGKGLSISGKVPIKTTNSFFDQSIKRAPTKIGVKELSKVDDSNQSQKSQRSKTSRGGQTERDSQASNAT